MKQNVNLFQPVARGGGGLDARGVCVGWLLAVFVVIGAQLWLAERVDGAQQALQQAEANLSAAEAALNELTASRMAGADPALEARLAEALRDLDMRQTILGLISGEHAGDMGGFSAQLRALARQNADGIWLTRVRVSAPGGRTTLEGKALDPEDVPHYLRQLSAERALAGQRFDVFEIQRPETDGAPIRFSLNRSVDADDPRLARQ